MCTYIPYLSAVPVIMSIHCSFHIRSKKAWFRWKKMVAKTPFSELACCLFTSKDGNVHALTKFTVIECGLADHVSAPENYNSQK